MSQITAGLIDSNAHNLDKPYPVSWCYQQDFIGRSEPWRTSVTPSLESYFAFLSEISSLRIRIFLTYQKVFVSVCSKPIYEYVNINNYEIIALRHSIVHSPWGWPIVMFG